MKKPFKTKCFKSKGDLLDYEELPIIIDLADVHIISKSNDEGLIGVVAVMRDTGIKVHLACDFETISKAIFE